MIPKLVVAFILSLILSIVLIFQQDTSGGLNPQETKGYLSVPGTAAISNGAVDELIKNQTEDHSTHWFYSDKREALLMGVALVIHGLNLRPDRMQPIISQLTKSGIDVLRVSLRGHGNNFSHRNGTDEDQARLESFKNVSYKLWMNEAYLAYLQLEKRAEEKEVPLFLTAFSLGGLIGLNLFASNSEVKFDKLVLFAPAIKLHAKIYIERVFSPFPRLVIPSMAPKTYLANVKGTPIAAYNALFDCLNQFYKNADQKLNVPTLIFIDEQDEFIPLKKLKKLVKEKKWHRWRFYLVEKDETAQDGSFYHHIIDASSTGASVWKDMMQAAVSHLLDQPSQ